MRQAAHKMIESVRQAVQNANLYTYLGKIDKIVGTTVESMGPACRIGDVCTIDVPGCSLFSAFPRARKTCCLCFIRVQWKRVSVCITVGSITKRDWNYHSGHQGKYVMQFDSNPVL